VFLLEIHFSFLQKEKEKRKEKKNKKKRGQKDLK
jgi:hypothetical protein